MTVNEVREKYLKFFEAKDHKVIPSASLVPAEDPTTLFTGSGMQPMLPYLLGEQHPLGTRITDSQKCLRAEDIDEVGDNRHTTFFEMLGNWSLGDYWKEEQLTWLMEFLTKEVGLNPKNLYVTVFSGDEKFGIPRDTETPVVWQKLFTAHGIEAKEVDIITEEQGAEVGMQGGRIFYYGSKKNWWSRWGGPENMPIGEPGGPDSEIFYDFGIPHDQKFGKECHPNCDCGRFLEIGNSVFMEYQRVGENSFDKLKQKNVDFGGGLERIAAASNENPDVFTIDAFTVIFSKMKEVYGQEWDYSKADEGRKKAMRIIADHLRASIFLAGDGVVPANKMQGYTLRKLLRRAIFKAYNLGEGFSNLFPIADTVIDFYTAAYPTLAEKKENIRKILEEEEQRFMKTLDEGLKKLEKAKDLDTKSAFHFYETYGLPLEVLQDKVSNFNEKVFEEEFKKHQELSRTSSAGMFKGGLVDHEPQTLKHHTAHHLLLAALRQVLGEHVFQRGSNVSSERLRIDFSHPEKMTDEQKKQVEELVNKAIEEDLEVRRFEMPKEEAEKLGALAEFGAKYGEVVSVYTIFKKDGSVFSREFCGGPHVDKTGELGQFKILKEEASSAGVRRIKAKVE